ncbi:MAG TPA: SDR family oxidoreductase [Firmicutes bacterium]|nr:SDR family oxidoreductase [Bacillota bacterium]
MSGKGRLSGRVALVTGVAGPEGIGYAVARALGREGAAVVITDVSEEVYERARELKDFNCDIYPYRVDLLKNFELANMVRQILDKFGRIEILVNVAGLAPRGSSEIFKYFVDLTEEEWDWTINVNLKTTFNCIKAVLPAMIETCYGRIVNISSVTGTIVAIEGESPYAAAKAAIAGLTRALALEVAKQGITVNAVAPGWVRTGSTTEEELEAGRATPIGRSAKPGEIADLVLFLSSDESSYITGQLHVIDGGNSIQEYKSANASGSVKME